MCSAIQKKLSLRNIFRTQLTKSAISEKVGFWRQTGARLFITPLAKFGSSFYIPRAISAVRAEAFLYCMPKGWLFGSGTSRLWTNFSRPTITRVVWKQLTDYWVKEASNSWGKNWKRRARNGYNAISQVKSDGESNGVPQICKFNSSQQRRMRSVDYPPKTAFLHSTKSRLIK